MPNTLKLTAAHIELLPRIVTSEVVLDEAPDDVLVYDADGTPFTDENDEYLLADPDVA